MVNASVYTHEVRVIDIFLEYAKLDNDALLLLLLLSFFFLFSATTSFMNGNFRS